MNALRTVLLGAGKSGKLLLSSLDSNDYVDVIAVVANQPSSAALVAGEKRALSSHDDSWLELRPDLVVIATPHASHFMQIRSALELGADVICDKPVTMSERDFHEVVSNSRAANRSVYCTMVQRCSQGVLDCRTYVRGSIDRLRHISIEQHLFRSDSYYRTWKGSPELAGGGVLINQGIHAIDLASFVTGIDFQLVDVESSCRAGVLVETSVSGRLVSESVSGDFRMTTDHTCDMPQRVTFDFGREKVVLVGSEVVNWCIIRDVHEGRIDVRQMTRLPDVYGPGYNEAIDDIILSISNGRRSRYQLEIGSVENSHQQIFRYYTSSRHVR